jgi:hypothetical protein
MEAHRATRFAVLSVPWPGRDTHTRHGTGNPLDLNAAETFPNATSVAKFSGDSVMGTQFRD